MLPRARMFAATLAALTLLAVWQLLTPAPRAPKQHPADDGHASRPDDAEPEATHSAVDDDEPAAGGLVDADPDDDDEDAAVELEPEPVPADEREIAAEAAAVAPFALADETEPG